MRKENIYLWTLQEVLDSLEPADADLAVHLFGLKTDGNFPDSGGKNILHLAEPLDELAAYKGLNTGRTHHSRLGKIQNTLFEARKKRVAPATDDKVLTDWNGLMIAALAKAGNLLGQPKYISEAVKTADFLLNQYASRRYALSPLRKGRNSHRGLP